ncbi:hypothetical protein [Streptomyces sp. NBC_00140]|uniref:hypothetical protein n=1 Tax=Streptomyces sp. NBC_00140 TaxID=2975664 RepID=UPI00224D5D20|nr:hypothetical protein [Streptomyces sp. NBC_00140]MCX5328576.1 hypothetical protein [Streptomyces sp. NBC_00140]
MDPTEELILELSQALLALFNSSRGAMHGIYQGSHEAALFEAQGGVIGPGGFNHLGDVLNTARNIQSNRDAAELALNRLQGVGPALGVRVRSLCDPVLKLADDYLRIARETNNAATVLRQTDPTRLQGVVLGQGGLGPEIGRTPQALVTNQLNAMSAQLTARNIEPRLIPSTQSALQPVLNSIRQLPLNGREAAAKLAGVLSAVRVLISQTAVRAGVIGRARLTAALLGIETALVEFGGRLTTPIIIIDRRLLHQLMGVPHVDGA